MYDSDTGTEWATEGEAVGAWIEIQFGKIYSLSKIETRHRDGGSSSAENFKDITLMFSDGTNQTATLQDGTDPEWNVVMVNPSVKTNSIKILAISAYGQANNGFSEIRFYGCPGKIKCSHYYTELSLIASTYIYIYTCFQYTILFKTSIISYYFRCRICRQH